MQTISVNEILLKQLMTITGMHAAEVVEESLKIALEVYTHTPNQETRETLEAADRGEDLYTFDTVEAMLADLKALK